MRSRKRSIRWLSRALMFLGFIAIAAGLMAPVPAGAEPGGNNGTVKVDGGDLNGNSNEPHVGCDFSIEWFGFDPGAESTVVFTMQSPTDDPATPGASASMQFGPIALDNNGNGAQSFSIYDLLKNFTPQQNQGFHVKLEVQAPWSNGNDTKYKTFWVTGCQEDEGYGSVTLDKVVSGPAPGNDASYTFTVTAEDPDSQVNSPVTIKASDPAVTVASNVTYDTTVTITETASNGAASTSYSVDGGPAQSGPTVVVTVETADNISVVATNTFTPAPVEVVGETTTQPPTEVLAEELARTGTDPLALVMFGVALVGAGTAVSIMSRRLRTAR